MRSINLRIFEKNASALQGRAERLRSGRATASLLREVSAGIARLIVRLRLRRDETASHAEESFVLYPAARAYFGFPCPYGDCNGIYDLTTAAQLALMDSKRHAIGDLSCSGTRSHPRIPDQLCGLQVSYELSAERRTPKGALDA